MARKRDHDPLDEKPDPRPSGRAGPMVTIEDGVRLSDSRLWKLQRAFFAGTDPRAWAASRVPSYITTNAFIARATARVVEAYCDDIAPERPTILELGAGSGRFAYHFLRHFRRDARYLATDLAPAQVDALRARPDLARDPRISFAALDAEDPRAIERIVPAGPLVVLANYFFDGIPADLYEIAGGELRESHLRLTLPEGLDPADPASLPRFATSFEPGPLVEAPYAESDLHELLLSHGRRLADGHFLFPIAGLRLMRRLRERTGGRLLVLAADRGHAQEEALLGLEPPHFERHGSFSLDVNFHALIEDARRTGGRGLHVTHHASHLATVALLWGEAPRAIEAFDAWLDAGGPEDLYVLKRTLERQKDRLDVERALAYLRTFAWDAEVFLICAPTLLNGIPAAPPGVRLDIIDAARRVREGYFPIGEDRDVPYALGEVFDALDAIPEAEACFEASLRLHGASSDTLHRLAVCASSLHRLDDAMARVEEALALDPGFEPARAMRIALAAELKRRPRDATSRVDNR